MSERNFFAELKRRNVYKVAVAYAVVGWLVIQVTATVVPALHMPDGITTAVVVLVLIGFPIALVIAWAFEMTPEGMKRTDEVQHERLPRWSGRKFVALIVTVALIAAGLLVFRLVGIPHSRDRAVRSDTNADTDGSRDRGTASLPANSIAVLPFVNMSEEKTNEFFADGISEELLNLLGKIPQLNVAARTSSFSFKGKGVEVPEIARQLRVANVLEGSVRKSGDQIRIAAQLIRAAEGYHLWSQTYDRKMDDIFKIQDEIAGEVVKELKVKLLGEAPKVRTTDPKAYALYLQSRELGRQNTPEAFAQSDALYRQALEIDPRYAPAWNGLAANFISKTSMAVLSSQEGHARAREAAEKALQIDPDYAPAHAQLGWIAIAGNDSATAAQHLQRALVLDPTDLDVLRNAATLLSSLGRLDEALALTQVIVGRDPVNVPALVKLGLYQRQAGRYDAAIASLRTALSLSPGRGGAHAELGTALILKGDAPAALAEIEQEKPGNWRMIGLPMAYCALGRNTDATAAVDTLIANAEKESAYNIAYVYAFCGDADKAFEWLDKALAYQDGGLGVIVPENLFDKIHSDPRWLPFLRKLGKAPTNLQGSNSRCHRCDEHASASDF